MNELVVALGWAGVYGAMALAAMGSIIGCAVAGQAAIGAMLETESGENGKVATLIDVHVTCPDEAVALTPKGASP